MTGEPPTQEPPPLCCCCENCRDAACWGCAWRPTFADRHQGENPDRWRPTDNHEGGGADGYRSAELPAPRD